MSYILDALNKSDQERRANETPTLDTHHHQPMQVKSRPNWIMWVIILLVLVTVGNFGMFWLGQSESADVAVSVAPEPEAVTVLKTEQAVQTQIPPVKIEVTPKTQQSLVSTPTTIGGLPAKVRSELPSLIFTSHMYADDKDLRLVNINGNMMAEGELISQGLKLETITEDGVIIHYQGYAIEMGVLQDWISE